MTQLMSGASFVVGLGKTATTLATLCRKRNLSAIWELDPVAAPPRCVQRRLLGCDAAVPAEIVHGAEDGADVHRKLLDMQLNHAIGMRDIMRVRAISRELRLLEEAQQDAAHSHAKANGELRVGDLCFVLAKVNEWEWYKGRLVGVRGRHPSLKVEYLANLEGDTSALALPQPRINHVPVEHVCLDMPRHDASIPIFPPAVPCVTVVSDVLP